MATTDRLPVLVTKDQKAKIAKRAKAANLTMGEFLRRAAFAYQPDQDDDKLLEGLINQVKKTTRDASIAIDKAMAFVIASQQRMAALEASRNKNKSRD